MSKLGDEFALLLRAAFRQAVENEEAEIRDLKLKLREANAEVTRWTNDYIGMRNDRELADTACEQIGHQLDEAREKIAATECERDEALNRLEATKNRWRGYEMELSAARAAVKSLESQLSISQKCRDVERSNTGALVCAVSRFHKGEVSVESLLLHAKGCEDVRA